MDYLPPEWNYICNTCGKERPSLNADGDCFNCAQIHSGGPPDPNATCSHCGDKIHLLDNQSSYWCSDCHTDYPREEAIPIQKGK